MFYAPKARLVCILLLSLLGVTSTTVTARQNATPISVAGANAPGLAMNSLSSIPAGGLIPREEDLSVLVARADLVVWGRVDTTESYWVSL